MDSRCISIKKKKLVIIISIVFIIATLITLIELYLENGTMYECLAFRVPLTAKMEKIELKEANFFDNEEMRKIYLTKKQVKNIIKKIDNNNAWQKDVIDERLDERMKFFTRENIYNQIPNIEHAYWIFKNRSHGVEDSHSIDELLNDIYYSVSFAILDTDNDILYYYEYDR